MTDVVWRELLPLTAELFHCDLCGEQANTIHLVPLAGVGCEHVLFACVRHDPGGYWFTVERWLTSPTLPEHVEKKTDYYMTTAERPGGYALLTERIDRLTNPVVGQEER